MIGRAPHQAADRVLIVVPALNEALHIRACLASLLSQAAEIGAGVLVLDGGSVDATRLIVQQMQALNPHLHLAHNPRRLQAAALNLAARAAPADVTVLIRADAHATYPLRFAADCLHALRRHDATSVVVPMRTAGQGGLQRAIAAVQNSRLGNGGSAHRIGRASGFVDHGHHAAFDRAFFMAVGGYDEAFSHNEDGEFDARAHGQGARIWMCAEAAIEYHPRAALLPLARQYYRHGRGRARTLSKHGLRPRARQLAAPAILLGCLAGAGLVPLTPWSAAAPGAYAASCVLWAIVAATQARDPWLLAVAPAAMAVHLGWAVGFCGAMARAGFARLLTASGRRRAALRRRPAASGRSPPHGRPDVSG